MRISIERKINDKCPYMAQMCAPIFHSLGPIIETNFSEKKKSADCYFHNRVLSNADSNIQYNIKFRNVHRSEKVFGVEIERKVP